MKQPLYYEVCRWINDNEPRYSNEVLSCGRRGQVITTCDKLEQAQAVHLELAQTGKSMFALYFINAGELV